MEVYGEKPKKYTRAWWDYVWYYYKWHFAITAFALLLIIVTCVQCVTKTNYDLSVDFVSEKAIDMEQTTALQNLIQENIDDVTGNGKNQANVLVLDMSDGGDAQMAQAMQTKLAIEEQCTEAFVFIMSEEYAKRLSDFQMFIKSSEWAGDKANDGCAVSLKDSKAFAKLGINSENLYAAVCIVRNADKNKESVKSFQENGKKLAKYLIQ